MFFYTYPSGENVTASHVRTTRRSKWIRLFWEKFLLPSSCRRRFSEENQSERNQKYVHNTRVVYKRLTLFTNGLRYTILRFRIVIVRTFRCRSHRKTLETNFRNTWSRARVCGRQAINRRTWGLDGSTFGVQNPIRHRRHCVIGITVVYRDTFLRPSLVQRYTGYLRGFQSQMFCEHDKNFEKIKHAILKAMFFFILWQFSALQYAFWNATQIRSIAVNDPFARCLVNTSGTTVATETIVVVRLWRRFTLWGLPRVSVGKTLQR